MIFSEPSNQGTRFFEVVEQSGSWTILKEWEEAECMFGGVFNGESVALATPRRFDEPILSEDQEYSRSSTPEGALRRYYQTKGWAPYDPAADL